MHCGNHAVIVVAIAVLATVATCYTASRRYHCNQARIVPITHPMCSNMRSHVQQHDRMAPTILENAHPPQTPSPCSSAVHPTKELT
eukprot:scaffold26197_cov22-Tisochrysis_lutea.AAC.1